SRVGSDCSPWCPGAKRVPCLRPILDLCRQRATHGSVPCARAAFESLTLERYHGSVLPHIPLWSPARFAFEHGDFRDHRTTQLHNSSTRREHRKVEILAHQRFPCLLCTVGHDLWTGSDPGTSGFAPLLS